MLWNDWMREFSWRPFREVRNLQRELDRLLGEPDSDWFDRGYPAVNVWSGKDDIVVSAEVPGVDPKQLDISVLGNTLILKVNRNPEELKEGEVLHRRERAFGEFVRTVELPVKVDSKNVRATYERGVLYVTLPRAEEDKPKQIKVKVS